MRRLGFSVRRRAPAVFNASDDTVGMLESMLVHHGFATVNVVVTTTHSDHLRAVAGDYEAIEIVGKPYDLERVVNAVKDCIQQ